MSKIKTTKNDSRLGEARTFENALSGVSIPGHLKVNAEIKPFLESILSLRAYDTWNPSDLAKAVNLARAQHDIERISAEIEREGDIVVNERGTPIMNPKHSLLETITRRELALSRAIHVHAEATLGRSRDSGDKGKKQKAALVGICGAKKKASGLINGI